jgi:hypothetical protein
MEIKFITEGADKYFRFDKYEFFAYKQGRDGYSLEVHEFFHVADKYQLNKYCSRKVHIPYEPECNLKAIRERIIQFINQNN